MSTSFLARFRHSKAFIPAVAFISAFAGACLDVGLDVLSGKISPRVVATACAVSGALILLVVWIQVSTDRNPSTPPPAAPPTSSKDPPPGKGTKRGKSKGAKIKVAKKPVEPAVRLDLEQVARSGAPEKVAPLLRRGKKKQ